MFGPIRGVVFDLDGTLIDTMPGVFRIVRQIYQELRPATVLSMEDMHKVLGPPPQEIFTRLFEAAEIPRAMKMWNDFIAAMTPHDLTPFPGVVDMLEGLKAKNISMAIFTGRDRAGTQKFLDVLGWENRYFAKDHIVCGDDGLGFKPSAAPLQHLAKVMPLDLPRTLMVGDSVVDVQSGQMAGCKTAAVLWESPSIAKLSGNTNRARYRAAWDKWNGVACDLRLENPQSLLHWLG